MTHQPARGSSHKPQRIVLGAYLLSGITGYRQAGIHQYIRALLDEFSSTPQMDAEITALVSPTALSEVPAARSHLTILPASRSTESPINRIRVEQLETPALLRQLRADVYHGMAFVAPLRAPCPTVITVHDLSFITQPRTHKVFNRIYLSLYTRLACRRAARVIAVSEWTKRDVVNLLGVDPARVSVIPHGVHARFTPQPPDAVAAFRARHRIGAQSIFFLGSLEPRKNLPALVEAYQRVLPRVPDAELIVGGSPGWKYEPLYKRIAELGLKDKVRFIGQVPQDELPMWYSACAVFAYPSLYEGFGMPVLEAMACGAPVVTSNATALPEVVGDAGLMVPPHDIDGLTHALSGVLASSSLQAELRDKSIVRARGFSWARAAEMTLAVLREI